MRDTTVNEIRRTAAAVFRFNIESFLNSAIISARAQLIYDCILSLARQSMTSEDRDNLLIKFCREITPPQLQDKINSILEESLGNSSEPIPLIVEPT